MLDCLLKLYHREIPATDNRRRTVTASWSARPWYPPSTCPPSPAVLLGQRAGAGVLVPAMTQRYGHASLVDPLPAQAPEIDGFPVEIVARPRVATSRQALLCRHHWPTAAALLASRERRSRGAHQMAPVALYT
ncbi:hypothetical protein DPSP01_005545 [Paraphaeosphaeria sporulosa]